MEELPQDREGNLEGKGLIRKKESSKEKESIPGLVGVPGRESSIRVVLKLESRIAPVLHKSRGRDLVPFLKTHVTDTKEKRMLVEFSGA